MRADLTWTTHLMDNECNDFDEVAEEINEIIRSVWTQQDYLCAVSILILLFH